MSQIESIATVIEDNSSSSTSTVDSFNTLLTNQSLLEALAKQNINSPSLVQQQAIPEVRTGKDQIVQAQTGSGKTLAFVLPILERLLALPRTRTTLALILTPTREIAQQVRNVIAGLTSEMQPVCVIGGAGMTKQIQQLKKDARIVIGTPGRITDLMKRRCLNLSTCQVFVLDEADEMLSMGFAPSVQEILSHIPESAQGLFFSATVSDRVISLAKRYLNNATMVNVAVSTEESQQIEHFFCRTDAGIISKTQTLCNLFEQQKVDSAIIFCNTKSDTEIVEKVLQRKGFNALRINSDLSQKQRTEVLDRLRSGKLQYLIATDVAARGIDVKNLGAVINYSIHKQSEVYVHRTGRTGRAGASGKAISIVSPLDFSSFHGLKKSLGITISEIPVASC